MARARKKAVSLESPDSRILKTVESAISDFLAHCKSNGLGDETYRKYRNSLNRLKAFCEDKSLDYVNELDTSSLDAFRSSRQLKPITASKELQLIRQFCTFCVGRKWIGDSPAKHIKMPRNLKPNDVEPFTSVEVAEIIKATGLIGQSSYERLRARAMILSLRYTALRIGDVALMARDRISKESQNWRIFLRTEKSGKPVFLPIPDEMVDALREVPTPRGVTGDSTHFFWNRISSPRSMKKNADDSLRSVFRKSGVAKAHAHRFRHTLATEMLGKGATFEEVADVLGNSPDVVRKHYAKWSAARQSRIDDLMKLVHSSAQYSPKKLLRVK